MILPDVRVKWTELGSPSRDPRSHFLGVLYAYLHPRTREFLYIGKSWGRSVWQRWNDSDKKPLKAYMRRKGIRGVIPLIGELYLPEGSRLTHQLLADVESLLINRHKPIGNILCVRSRNISRPGMVITCLGKSWRGKRRYVDS